MDEELLTARAAASAAGVTTRALRGWQKAGRLVPAGERQTGGGPKPLYRRADVLRCRAETADRGGRPKSTAQMTAEELDAFVAERMANTPKWWASETKVAPKEVAKTLRDVVKSRVRGRKKK